MRNVVLVGGGWKLMGESDPVHKQDTMELYTGSKWKTLNVLKFGIRWTKRQLSLRKGG
jgi:hypothetical protein